MLESVFVASVQKAVFVRFMQCTGVCVRPVEFLSWCESFVKVRLCDESLVPSVDLFVLFSVSAYEVKAATRVVGSCCGL